MNNSKKSEDLLTTTKLSVEIIKTIEEEGGATLSDLSDIFDRPSSTIHTHLRTLVHLSFLVVDDGVYQTGPEILRLGNNVRNRKMGYKLAERYVNGLYEQTGYRTTFAALMGGRCVFMHVKSGERSDWQHEEIGEQLYLHNTAVGKAILSTMSDEKVQSVIEQWGLPQTTESTITDTAELKEEVERTRKRGYAINRGENIEGLYALGVPIVGHEDEIIGGISMSGPRTILPEYAENTDHLEKLQYEREEFELELKLS